MYPKVGYTIKKTLHKNQHELILEPNITAVLYREVNRERSASAGRRLHRGEKTNLKNKTRL